MKTISGGPATTTDNLILYLDAANNKSYSGTGTTWLDLTSQGNNGTLVNGPTFSSANVGSIVLDGTDDYVSTTLKNTPSAVTIDIVLSIASNTASKTGGNTVAQYIVFRQNNQISLFEGIVLNYIQSGASGYISANTSQGSTNKAANTSLINLNQIYHITATYDSSNVTIYSNGALIQQTPTGFSVNYNATHTYSIGRANGIGSAFDGYLNGKIYYVSIYERSLSQQEIIQNYNKSKSRFGL
jgi:hypothetical protein